MVPIYYSIDFLYVLLIIKRKYEWPISICLWTKQRGFFNLVLSVVKQFIKLCSDIGLNLYSISQHITYSSLKISGFFVFLAFWSVHFLFLTITLVISFQLYDIEISCNVNASIGTGLLRKVKFFFIGLSSRGEVKFFFYNISFKSIFKNLSHVLNSIFAKTIALNFNI